MIIEEENESDEACEAPFVSFKGCRRLPSAGLSSSFCRSTNYAMTLKAK